MSRVMLRRRLVVVLVAMLVGGVAYAVYALEIGEIRVTGLRTLDPKHVIDRSGLRGGERLLLVRLSAVARRIEQIPAVASARAERSFPQTVVIHVSERMPVARLPGPDLLVVDADGKVFSSPDATMLPLAEGIAAEAREGARIDEDSRTVVAAFAAFPEPLRVRTARLGIGPPLTLGLNDGTEIRFGDHSDLGRKAKVATAILDAERGNELAYVDVRSPSVPVSRRRDPPTPAPTPAPDEAPAADTAPAPAGAP